MKLQPEPGPLHEIRQPPGWRLPLLVAALVGLGVLAGIIWLGPPGSRPETAQVPDQLPPLNAEAKAYVPQVEIGSLEISRWANFLGQEVIYLDLTLTNQGTGTILALELTIEFLDAYNRVVLRETVRPIGARRTTVAAQRAAPLPPGQSRDFRASFEELPAAWNRLPPRIRVTGLLLQ